MKFQSLWNRISSNLGEAGGETFRKILLASDNEKQEDMLEPHYWVAWVSYLSSERIDQETSDEIDEVQRARDQVEAAKQVEELLEQEADVEEEDKGWQGFYEKIHARFAPSRRLRDRFFEREVIDLYEEAYIKVSGSLTEPIKAERIAVMLSYIFVDFPFRFSHFNAREFLETFGQSGNDRQIIWADMRKVLREHRMGTSLLRDDTLLVGSAINPTLPWVSYLQHIGRLCGVYYFVWVPVRIAFLPFDTFTHKHALASDLTADCLVWAFFILHLNTAYKNSHSKWVTDRYKILIKSDPRFLLGVLPLDWFGYVCGASNEVCCFLRLNHLLLITARLRGRGVRPVRPTPTGVPCS